MMWPPKKGANSTTSSPYSTGWPSSLMKDAISPAWGACAPRKESQRLGENGFHDHREMRRISPAWGACPR